MESERMARVEKSMELMAPRVERIELKIDLLLESKWKRDGAIIVICFIISILGSVGVELVRAFQ
jgi:hypothetical protein